MDGSGDARRVLHVVQGAYDVSGDPGVHYTALIGASVLICLHDPVSKMGGMVHFIFPNSGLDARFGAVALGRLRAGLITLGADHGQLVAKLFGGATLAGCGDLGCRNADFARRALKGVPIETQELGGDLIRQVWFRPFDGTATSTAQNHPALTQA
jgi:chemotaxis protein CheD